MVSDKLKKFIFKRLYKELGNTEIIPYNGSIWFIDREEKYWYFDFENSGALYWRYGFFPNFFEMFSLECEDFEPILASWVEEVLNHKVDTTLSGALTSTSKVEEVLNHKVDTTKRWLIEAKIPVEEVLNHKVDTTQWNGGIATQRVEEVLNHRVSSTVFFVPEPDMPVEEVLNHKSFTKIEGVWRGDEIVEEILNNK